MCRAHTPPWGSEAGEGVCHGESRLMRPFDSGNKPPCTDIFIVEETYSSYKKAACKELPVHLRVICDPFESTTRIAKVTLIACSTYFQRIIP